MWGNAVSRPRLALHARVEAHHVNLGDDEKGGELESEGDTEMFFDHAHLLMEGNRSG